MVAVAVTVYCSKSITAQGWFCNYSLHEKVRFNFFHKKKKADTQWTMPELAPLQMGHFPFSSLNFFELFLFTESFHGPAK